MENAPVPLCTLRRLLLYAEEATAVPPESAPSKPAKTANRTPPKGFLVLMSPISVHKQQYVCDTVHMDEYLQQHKQRGQETRSDRQRDTIGTHPLTQDTRNICDTQQLQCHEFGYALCLALQGHAHGIECS